MKVVLLTIDAWRASHTSFGRRSVSHVDELNGSCTLTPNLASFAEEGVVFSQAFAHGPATPYAFPSLFTSTLPLDYGGYEQLSSQRTLVTEPLSEAGWRCIGFHSNPWLKEKYGYGRGYDRYADVGEFSLPLLERGHDFLHTRFDKSDRVYQFAQRVYRRFQRPLRYLTSDKTEVELAADALAATPEKTFIWAHLLTPHAPYEPPPEHQRYVGIDSPITTPEPLITRGQQQPASLTKAEKQTIRQLYAAAVRHADEQLGEILSSIDDETLVIITADHGEALFERGQLGHDPLLYEELLHVPLVIRPPGGASQNRVDVPVQHMDIAPTVLDYAGIDPPESYDGKSLRPLIESPEQSRSGTTWHTRPTIMEVASTSTTPKQIDPDALQVAVRVSTQKLYFNGDETLGFELDADPHERTPLRNLPDAEWGSIKSVLNRRLTELEGELESRIRPSYDTNTEQRLRDLGYLE